MLVSGCAVVPPTAPTIAVAPGPGKTAPRLQAEAAWCRRVGTATVQANQPYGNVAPELNAATANTALHGAAIGALAGAIGGRPGVGALAGLAYGLVVSSIAADSVARRAGAHMQHLFDAGYAQCMAAYGNRPLIAQYGAAQYGVAY